MKKIIVGLVISMQVVVAGDDPSYPEHAFYTQYNGGSLDAKTLSTYAHNNPLKTATNDGALSQWLLEKHDLLKALANQPIDPEATEYEPLMEPGNKLLQEAGYTNKSKNNFVFSVELEHNKTYCIKVAGPHRFEQCNALLGRPWGTPVTQEDLASLAASNRHTTYTSASRMAHYLLYKKWKEAHQHVPIETPKTYLLSLSDEHLIDDANALIAEEHIDAIGTPMEFPETFLEKKCDIRNFIIHMGLWNINPSQFLIKRDGVVVCVDLEDPNNSNPDDFFSSSYEKIKSNIRCGLRELDTMCEKLKQAKDT